MGWPIVVLPSWVKCKNGTEGRPEMVEGHDFNVAVLFTPDPSCFVDSKTKDFKPGGTPAESLFHELVHAFRHVTETASKRPGPYKGAQKNPFVPSALKKNYPEFDEEEEFFAVLITNIFSSETGRPLRKDHNDLEALPPELSTNKGFLAVEEYARLIRQFCGEHRSVSQQIRDVSSQFNPIKEVLIGQGGPTPRERGLRNILAGRYFSNSSSCILSLSPASPCKTAPSPVGWSKNTLWTRWLD